MCRTHSGIKYGAGLHYKPLETGASCTYKPYQKLISLFFIMPTLLRTSYFYSPGEIGNGRHESSARSSPESRVQVLQFPLTSLVVDHSCTPRETSHLYTVHVHLWACTGYLQRHEVDFARLSKFPVLVTTNSNNLHNLYILQP